MRRLFGCLIMLGCVQCKVSPSETKKAPPPAATASKRESLEVSYRLDPRLAGGTYGGERWISGASYTSSAQPGRSAVVEAKVPRASAKWTASDPTMVNVSPVFEGRFDRVRITANKPGVSKLTVTDKDATTELVVRASSIGDSAMQVEIAQNGGTL